MTLKELFEKYGFVMPQTPGMMTLKPLQNQRFSQTDFICDLDSSEEELQKLYSQPYNQDESFQTHTDFNDILKELHFLLLSWENETDIADVLRSQINFSYAADRLIYDELLEEDTVKILVKNHALVNNQKLTERKPQVLQYLKETVGDFNNSGVEVMLEFPTHLYRSKDFQPFTHFRNLPVKKSLLDQMLERQTLAAVSAALETVGSEVKDEALQKDFWLVDQSLAKALNKKLGCSYTSRSQRLSEETKEIYLSLKKENHSFNLNLTALLETAWELTETPVKP